MHLRAKCKSDQSYERSQWSAGHSEKVNVHQYILVLLLKNAFGLSVSKSEFKIVHETGQ